MDFELSEEQESFRKVVRDFADGEIAPHAEAWDRDHTFPVDTVLAMGELGLFGLPFPEEYGGSGSDFTTLCVAIEELGRVDQSMAITLEAGVGLGANPIYAFGTEEQRQQWLPDLCAGRALGGFGLTEPEAGSDAGGTRTRAVLDEARGRVGDRRREGVHHELGHADHVARHRHRPHRRPDRSRPRSARSSSPPAPPGFEVQPPYRKMGWHASDTHGLTFTGCRVPEANLLGERGRGFANFLATLDDGRIAIAALALGTIEACLEHSVAVRQGPQRVRQADRQLPGRRVQVRRPRGDGGDGPHARLRGGLAEGHRPAVQAARGHGEALRHRGRGHRDPRGHADLRRLRLHGRDRRSRRFYRDSKILEIGEGTSEVQRLVISRELGLGAES